MPPITVNPSTLKEGLQGKTAIVTGGANGIGRATVELLHANGANVIIADVMDSDGEALQERLGRKRARYVRANVTVWAEMVDLFETAREAFNNGRIDIAIANAGLMERTNFLDENLDEEGKLAEPNYAVVDVNLKGALNTTKLALHYFKKNIGPPGGALVLVSSISGYFGGRDVLQYKASKHGVIGVMRGTAGHAADIGAHVTAIAPYMTQTQMTSGFSKDWLDAGIPSNKPEDVAEAICLAAADPSLNGCTLWVTGGKITEVEKPLMNLASQWLGEENWDILQRGAALLAKGYKLPPKPREI
ncbi:hypothetical protein VTN77DRAFT_1308 [Rasamsonia byssochlamydoides]|uniref:uncharacterized protein n=1 Tax=Rasamsonia byssochlamydoides TaxID=89139 RepID=UPI003742FD60